VVIGNPNQWYNVSMFDLPALGQLGNAGRTLFNGPDLREVDLSINKDTKAGFLGEAGQIEFRAELFNLFNHPNFGMPGSTSAGTTVVINNSTSPTITGQAVQPFVNGAFSNPANPANSISTAAQVLFTNTTSRQIQLALKFLF
jgi:hypothetical protein